MMLCNTTYQLGDLAAKLARNESTVRRHKRLRTVTAVSIFVALAVLIYG